MNLDATGGFQGLLLIISNTRNTNTLRATYTTYSVFGRGTTGQFTQIATSDGTTAPCPFSLTIPSAGVLRATNKTNDYYRDNSFLIRPSYSV